MATHDNTTSAHSRNHTNGNGTRILRVRDWDQNFEINRTRELKTAKWVAIPNKMDGLGYVELVTHPNGAAHFGAWIAILEVASKCDTRGTLVRDGEVLDARRLAAMTRLPRALFEEVIERLIHEIQWLEEIPQEGATIPQESAVTPQETATILANGAGGCDTAAGGCDKFSSRARDTGVLTETKTINPPHPDVNVLARERPEREAAYEGGGGRQKASASPPEAKNAAQNATLGFLDRITAARRSIPGRYSGGLQTPNVNAVTAVLAAGADLAMLEAMHDAFLPGWIAERESEPGCYIPDPHIWLTQCNWRNPPVQPQKAPEWTAEDQARYERKLEAARRLEALHDEQYEALLRGDRNQARLLEAQIREAKSAAA